MNKHLVNNESEFMALFDEFDLEDAEDFLGIEFAYEDGAYQSDDNEPDIETSRTIYRDRFDYEGDSLKQFPNHYPCLVLLANDKDFDRTGNISFKMMEFIYKEDFKE